MLKESFRNSIRRTAEFAVPTVVASSLVGGYVDQNLTRHCEAPKTVIEHTSQPGVALEQYARQFDRDPLAGKLVDAASIAQTVQVAKDKQRAGFKKIVIATQPWASAEDDTTKNGVRTGGFRTESLANLRLSAVRGVTYDTGLAEELVREHVGDVTIVPLPPREDALTGEQEKALTQMAEHFGFSAAELADANNGLLPGRKVPAQAKPLLFDLFDSKRRVVTTVSGTREVTTQNCVQTPPIFAWGKPDRENAYIPTPLVLEKGDVEPNYNPLIPLRPQTPVKPPVEVRKQPRPHNEHGAHGRLEKHGGQKPHLHRDRGGSRGRPR